MDILPELKRKFLKEWPIYLNCTVLGVCLVAGLAYAEVPTTAYDYQLDVVQDPEVGISNLDDESEQDAEYPIVVEVTAGIQTEDEVVEEVVEEYVESTYVEPSYSSSYSSSYSGTTYSYSSYNNDFKSQGVVYDENGTRYTWYSQRVLPGTGLTELNNNGRTVNSDGFVTDGDGYLAVASSDYAIGTVLETPFGTAKVYDTGCASGTVDMYTDF